MQWVVTTGKKIQSLSAVAHLFSMTGRGQRIVDLSESNSVESAEIITSRKEVPTPGFSVGCFCILHQLNDLEWTYCCIIYFFTELIKYLLQ